MRPVDLLTRVIRPALSLLSELAGKPMGSTEAEVLMLAIAMQESGAKHRAQIRGPARSYWQFERRGGFYGVREHDRTQGIAADLVEALDLPTDEESLWLVFPNNDLLAAGFARLLIYSDNAPLPKVGDQGNAWSYYLRNWRPGKPHPGTWGTNYQEALDTVRSNTVDAPQPTTSIRDQINEIYALLNQAAAKLTALPA